LLDCEDLVYKHRQCMENNLLAQIVDLLFLVDKTREPNYQLHISDQ
jgi:hypothetical protein